MLYISPGEGTGVSSLNNWNATKEGRPAGRPPDYPEEIDSPFLPLVA